MLLGSSNVFLGKFATSLSCFFISGTRFSILNFFTITAMLAPTPAEPAKKLLFFGPALKPAFGRCEGTADYGLLVALISVTCFLFNFGILIIFINFFEF